MRLTSSLREPAPGGEPDLLGARGLRSPASRRPWCVRFLGGRALHSAVRRGVRMSNAGGDDLYGLLGVDRHASADDLKRAYRKQAMKWHPDKNPNNRDEAELRFKMIAEAYEILSDEGKREVYDSLGIEAVRDGVSSSRGNYGASGGFHVDPFEMFNSFFGGRDPFQEMFGGMGGDPFGRGADPFGGRPAARASPSPFGAFGGGMGMGGFGGMGMLDEMMRSGGMMSSSTMSSSMGSMGGGTSRSTSTSTVIQNGRRVTRTTTTIRHADGR